jgi:hypothetical protein
MDYLPLTSATCRGAIRLLLEQLFQLTEAESRMDDDCKSTAETLCAIAKLDAESCVANARQMIAASLDYTSFTSLHSSSQNVIQRQRNIVYKHFF